MTYNDALAEIYGRKRFGHGEGLHGALASHFGPCKGKRWFRRADQAKTDTALILALSETYFRKRRVRM